MPDTPIIQPRIPLTDPRTGLISREWYRYLVNQSILTGGSALTRTNDSNVTLTLGGTPNTALLAPVSLTLGWTGQLPISRGGTGAATATDALTNLGAAASVHSHAISDVTNLQTTLDGKVNTSLLGAASGVATLDSSGVLNISQIPAIAITNTYVVASEAEMLALTAQTGDVAVRSDLKKSFILKGSNAATLTDWQELLTPTDAVLSVNSKTGAVTLYTDDISEDGSPVNLWFTDARARAAMTKARIEELLTGTITSHNHTGTYEPAFTTLGVTKGGTGLSTIAVHSLLYASAADTLATLAPNTGTAKRFLTMTGTGTAGAAPAWAAIAAGDIPDLSGTYLPLTGGTLTGGLSGTTATFSGTSDFYGRVLIKDNTTAITDGGLINTPVLYFTGRYDSDTTTAVVSSNYDMGIQGVMTAGGGSPAGKLSFQLGGTERAYVNSAGALNTTGGFSIGGTTVIDSSRNFFPNTKVDFGVWLLGNRVNGTNNSPYFSTRVDAPAFSVVPNPFDQVNNSPWYGIGMSDAVLGTTNPAGQTAVQVAGYFGLRLRTNSAILDLYQTGGAVFNGAFDAVSFKANGTTVIDSSRNIFPVEIKSPSTNAVKVTSNGTTGYTAGFDLYHGATYRGYVGVPDASATTAPNEVILYASDGVPVSLWGGGVRGLTLSRTVANFALPIQVNGTTVIGTDRSLSATTGTFSGMLATSGTGYGAATSPTLKLTNNTATTGRVWGINSFDDGIFQVFDITAGNLTRFSIGASGAASFGDNAVSMGGLTATTGTFSGIVYESGTALSSRYAPKAGTANSTAGWNNVQTNGVTSSTTGTLDIGTNGKKYLVTIQVRGAKATAGRVDLSIETDDATAFSPSTSSFYMASTTAADTEWFALSGFKVVTADANNRYVRGVIGTSAGSFNIQYASTDIAIQAFEIQ